MLEYLFNKIADLKACKKTPTQAFSCEYSKVFKSTFFTPFLWCKFLRKTSAAKA